LAETDKILQKRKPNYGTSRTVKLFHFTFETNSTKVKVKWEIFVVLDVS